MRAELILIFALCLLPFVTIVMVAKGEDFNLFSPTNQFESEEEWVIRPPGVDPPNTHPLYRRSECIGPVVAGVCRGYIAPKHNYRPVCHGTWLNGKCTGPEF